MSGAEVAGHVAVASKAWLAGDLDLAIAELDKAGGDPRVRSLLARAYDLAGRSADAQRTASSVFGAGRPKARMRTDVSTFDAVVISPDGAFIATLGKQRSVTVWSTLSGRDVVSAPGYAVAFGAGVDGEMLVAIIDKKLRVLNAATGVEQWADTVDAATLAIDRHNTLTAIAARPRTIVQWNLSTGARLRSFPSEPDATAIEVSDDGRTMLTSERDGVAWLYDVSGTPSKLATLAVASPGSSWDLSPDGQMVAEVRRDRTVVLYTRDGTPHAQLNGAGYGVRFLDDGTLIAIANHHLLRWDVANNKELGGLEVPRELLAGELTVGRGGHVMGRRGPELAMVQLKTGRAAVIASFGFSSPSQLLAWSQDGARLAVASSSDIIVWGVAGTLTAVPRDYNVSTLGFDAKGAVTTRPPDEARFEITNRRVFMRDATGRVVRFIEAREEVTLSTLAGGRLVTTGKSGTLQIWNADTAEGLGEIAGPPVIALALRPDGQTLAVARAIGGVELWDLRSRSQVLTVVTWHDGWMVVTPSGRVDGQLQPLAWHSGDLTFPGATGSAYVERGLAADVLAHPPTAVTIAPTPAPTIPVRACLPGDVENSWPTHLSLAGQVVSSCVQPQGDTGDQFCFRLDLTTKAMTPIAAPIQVLANDSTAKSTATAERVDNGLKLCPIGKPCQTFVVTVDPKASITVSDDGEVVAFSDASKTKVETWDVAAGKRIARFKVQYTQGFPEVFDRFLRFVNHIVVAVAVPCAGPCAVGVMYDVRGKLLGELPIEAGVHATKFHDDIWVLTNEVDERLLLMDTRTGTVVAHRPVGHDVGQLPMIDVTPDHIAVLVGFKPVGKVTVLDRALKVIAEAAPPVCR